VRLLTNENIPLATIRRLREQGHDVASIVETAAGSTDEHVLRRAHDEDRVLLTFDRDYGELIYVRGLPCPSGLIYLRFTPSTPEKPAE
jgi:predicted nuclease of predicted toxin-antitoxin system